jgi:adenylate kinase family enzyme
MFTKMLLSDILKLDLVRKNVVIIGAPSSGKTYLSEKMKEVYPYHSFIHSDDFIQYGFEDGLYEMIREIKKTDKYCIIEGILCYRLLRKGAEQGSFSPDYVIQTHIADEDLEKAYKDKNEPEKLPKVRSLIKSNQTVFELYCGMEKQKNPIFIELVREEMSIKVDKPEKPSKPAKGDKK